MKPATALSALVFLIIAAAHVLRLALGVQVRVGDTQIPMWVSIVGGLVALVLAGLLFREGCGCCATMNKPGGGETYTP